MWGLISPITIDSQGNLDSSLLHTKLASTAPTGINTTRTTRSSVANNKQIGQYKGGNTTILYTTAKALKDNAAKKRAVSKRNQQSSSAQVIFSCNSTTCEYLGIRFLSVGVFFCVNT